MHPNPLFRIDSRAVHEALIAEVGFGMIFAATPAGPRVAHTPIISTGTGTIRFHLANANALSPHLVGAEVLAVINGPDGYISPRWYAEPGQVPTWNYIALELTGSVIKLSREDLAHLLGEIGAQHEARLPGGPQWRPADVPQEPWDKMLGAITGYEMAVKEWRPTFKLSQNKPAATRTAIADGLAATGNPALAHAMREQAA